MDTILSRNLLSAVVQGVQTIYRNDHNSYLNCLSIIGCVAFLGGPNGAHIANMFDLGLSDVLLHALSLEENETCISKALYICLNIVNDDLSNMLQFIQFNNGEIFEKCVETLVSS